MARTVKPNEYGVITSCPKDVKEAVIPAGVTAIGVGAFDGCAALASVVIPAGVTAIGAAAFKGCKALASVVIPESVTRIGRWAFIGCKSLASVEFGGTMAQWEAVEKGYEWHEYVPAKGVKCADGEARL